MRNYLARRLFIMIPVFVGILFLLFLIANLAPGGPTANMLDPRMTAEMKAELDAKMGLDLPLPVRFVNWAVQALQGNLGYSSLYRAPVMSIIGDFIGQTFLLSLSALAFGMIVGVPCGIVSATRRHTLADHGLTVFSLIGISIPSFFFGLLLLKFFALDIPIFPLFGASNPGLAGGPLPQVIADRLMHLVLPTIVLGLGSAASFMRYTRSSMLEVIRQDYIRTARAKGLKERVVIYRHALRNAVIPIITLLGFQIPALFSGAVITESIFALPGIGKLQVDAVLQRDCNLFMGINALVAFLTLAGALVADILYAVADPRVKYD
jgi:peptide/nickel transport system permease protein